MVSNQRAYLKNKLMKVLACMKEDEAGFIKYSRIESEKNAIDTLSQPSPKLNSFNKKHFKYVVQIRGNTSSSKSLLYVTFLHKRSFK